MKTEVRFLLAIFLMLGVLVGTNLLFPPVPVEELSSDSLGATLTAEEGASSTGPASTGGTATRWS